MSEWKPIETAPKDGTEILIEVVHMNAKYSDDPDKEGWIAECRAHWIDFNHGGFTWEGLAGSPTRWKPLPPPPQDQP